MRIVFRDRSGTIIWVIDRLYLELEDLKIRKGSWDKQSDSPENDLNLIDEEDIDKIMIKDLGNELEVENGSKNTTPDRLLSKGSKP